MNKQIQALCVASAFGQNKKEKECVKYNTKSKNINKRVIIIYIDQDKTGDKLF